MTLVELLVAMTITLAVAAAALSLALSDRGSYEVDRGRTDVNQNLRIGIDLLGLDVRQAGERLPGDFPAIELADGGSGPDVLTLRRNLLEVAMPVCADISAGSGTATVSVATVAGTIPPGCAPVPDDDGDGWAENLEAWRDFRVAAGGEVMAYIFNPASGDGEFFRYDAEDETTYRLHRNGGGSWQFDYDVDDMPRVYLLEQRTLRVTDGLLECEIDGDATNTLRLIADIDDFQASAVMDDGSIRPSLTPTDRWTDLRSIEITLVGERNVGSRVLQRSLTTRFFPRNVLSR